MHDLKSQVAYLHGLVEGMNLSDDSSEGRAINAIVNVLDEVTEAIEHLHTNHNNLEHILDSMDEDIAQLEEEVFEEELEMDDQLEDDEDDEFDFVEVDCPQCKEVVCFESDLLDEDGHLEILCPNCEEVVFMNDNDDNDTI